MLTAKIVAIFLVQILVMCSTTQSIEFPEVETNADLRKQFVKADDKIVMVTFFDKSRPFIEELKIFLEDPRNADLHIVRADVTKAKVLVDKYDVKETPSHVILHHGNFLEKIVTSDYSHIRHYIDDHLPLG